MGGKILLLVEKAPQWQLEKIYFISPPVGPALLALSLFLFRLDLNVAYKLLTFRISKVNGN